MQQWMQGYTIAT